MLSLLLPSALEDAEGIPWPDHFSLWSFDLNLAKYVAKKSYNLTLLVITFNSRLHDMTSIEIIEIKYFTYPWHRLRVTSRERISFTASVQRKLLASANITIYLHSPRMASYVSSLEQNYLFVCDICLRWFMWVNNKTIVHSKSRLH